MAKNKNPMTRKEQTQEVAQNLKDLHEVQVKPSPIKKVTLNQHKKPNSIRSKPKKKKGR